MGMSINTNVSSLNAQRALSTSQGLLQTSMQRLSTGLRVNSSKDDAAGLAIAERMNAQVKGMNAAMRNANDGISMLQTVDGSLGKITESLQRMRELAVQAGNGVNSNDDYTNLNTEFASLQSEITRVVGSTAFNGKGVLNGNGVVAAAVAGGTTPTAPGSTEYTVSFQIGANNTTANDQIDVVLKDFTNDVSMLSVTTSDTSKTMAPDGATAITPTRIDSQAAARTAIDSIDAALKTVSAQRSTYGATQNRFEAVVSNLQISSENTASSRGRIMDADFATETANLSRAQVLQQAGTAMLSQANQSTQNVMQLLR